MMNRHKNKCILKLIILLSPLLIFSDWQQKSFTKRIANGINTFSPEVNKTVILENNQKKEDSIICDNSTFNTYPDLSRVKNKEIKAIFIDVQKLVINKSFFQAKYKPLSEDLIDYLLEGSNKINFNNYGYSNLCTRIDGEKITWAPVAQLPTNGKFIMMIFANWESGGYEPPSTAFFLFTFNLSGEVQSIIYIYGREEFIRNNNIDLLSSIAGRTYCLNTNKFSVRKAVFWDEYDYRDGFKGCTLEINEFNYLISEEGTIKCLEEKIIFSQKHVKWKDREGIPFYKGSDTVRKMLGEIE